MTTLRDIGSRERFITALVAILGCQEPNRSQLVKLGKELAPLTNRGRPWGYHHLYNLMHWDHGSAYARYGINSNLFHAVLKLAGMEALNGKKHVEVIADHVRVGAVVLLPSRKCARRRCKIHFVGLSKFCSTSCRKRAQAWRRRKRIEERRREKHGRRRTTHKARAA